MSEFVTPLHRRPALASVLPAAGTIGLGLFSGWLVSNGHVSSILIASMAAVAALGAVAKWNPGVAVGLLLIAVMNGLPGIDLASSSLPLGFRLSDFAVFLLIGLLSVRIHAMGATPGPLARRVVALGLILAAWWLAVLLRTTVADGVPLLQAILFGRDFIYFAILLPLITLGLHERRELLGCLVTLFVGALLFSIAVVGVSAAGASLGSGGWAGFFAHATAVKDANGATRVFAIMGDALAPTVAFGLGLALMPPQKQFARTAGIVLFGVALVATLYLETRALYIGTFIALLFTTMVFLFASGSNAARRTFAVLCAVLIILVVAINFGALTSSVSGVGAASTRAASTVTELEQRSGNIGYRYQLDRRMLDILGSSWVAGLGFLNPISHPVAGLPDASIRNTDVGVMNSLMTMGAVGTVLLYLTPVVVLLAVLRRWNALGERDQRRDVEWLLFGATMWLIVVLTTSVSLVTLFSVSGLAMSATVMACAARLVDETRDREQ